MRDGKVMIADLEAEVDRLTGLWQSTAEQLQGQRYRRTPALFPSVTCRSMLSRPVFRARGVQLVPVLAYSNSPEKVEVLVL